MLSATGAWSGEPASQSAEARLPKFYRCEGLQPSGARGPSRSWSSWRPCVVIFESRALRIAISGHSGCGNTTATDNVGKTLRLDVVNYTFRDLAKDLEIRFDEIQQKSNEARIFDFLTDLRLIRAS